MITRFFSITILLGLLGQMFVAVAALAYEVDTHMDISEKAVERSILNDILPDIGLANFNTPIETDYLNEPPSPALFWIRYGANHEDDTISDALSFTRYLNHFYNPLTGSGLFFQPPLSLCSASGTLRGHPSPDWGLKEGEAANANQIFSFKDGRDYFYKGLTLSTARDRAQYLAMTFRTLGQVMHLIQDAAQPQHTRNDSHGPGCYGGGSLYEYYTNLENPPTRPNLPYDGYEAVYGSTDTTSFDTPRKFWTTSDGKGMADYSNRGFVTTGTNFDQEPNPFPSPTLGLGREEDKTSLCNAINMPRPKGPDGQPLPCIMTFIETPVEDRYRPNPHAINREASTFSIFNADLMNYVQKPLFTLNHFNFDAAHQFLIPRAVGYSAGLINYFFRGKIDLVPDTNAANPGGYLLKNLGEEEISGTFTLYYDDVNDTRHAWRVWTTPGPLPVQTGNFAVPAFASPGSGDPAPKYPGQYILVFTGQMGQEAGAVAGKVVAAAASGLILTAGGDAAGFARPGDGGAVTIETGASVSLGSPVTTALSVAEGDTFTLGGGSHHYSEVSIAGTLQLTADTVLQADGPVGISGTVEGYDERHGINLTIESGEVIAVSGMIDVAGRSGAEMGSGDQLGGNGGSVTLRTASAEVFFVPTIITRGGDAALTDVRVPAKTFTGGVGGPIIITTNGMAEEVALRFAGTERPTTAVDTMPSQQGAHTLPSTTTFRRGLLTTGGYGGQFKGPDGELGVTVGGTTGGAGGSISITCAQPSLLHFEKTDLFTGGNIDVLLTYTRQVVFSAGQTPRLVNFFQRTGAMGGQGSSGQTHTHGGSGGSGGAGGAITIAGCELAVPPASFTSPPRVAPLILGGNVVTGLVTAPRPRIIDALDATGTRLYTIQAFGGGGGLPGGSGLSLARCSKTGAQCYTDGVACPLAPDLTAQICLPVTGGSGSPGNWGTRGADGPVSCGPLLIPGTLVGTGLVCQ